MRWWLLYGCLWMGMAAAQSPSPAFKVGDRLPQNTAAVKDGYLPTTWEKLLPEGWNPADAFKGLQLNRLQDGDPKAMEALEKMRQMWDNAPVNNSLNGSKVHISGFLVPLDAAGAKVKEFLLVPYFGACIHTPPPPANQIIYVKSNKPVPESSLMAPVSVSGQLGVSRADTWMGKAGYTLQAVRVEPFTGK